MHSRRNRCHYRTGRQVLRPLRSREEHDIPDDPRRPARIHQDRAPTFGRARLLPTADPGGASRAAIAAMSARARGFNEAWHPRAESWELVSSVQHLLDEYVEQLPLTLQQIFYILVGRHAYEKTERAYERLCETLNEARRAKVVDMDAVRDDGFTNEIPNFFGSANHLLDSVKSSARLLRLDRQAGQARRLALWCEASGMVPQLQRIADPFGIGTYSSGGFDSVTAKHQIARLWADEPVTVLHVGDHDPSGVHCFSSLAEDVASFADFPVAQVADGAADRRHRENDHNVSAASFAGGVLP